MIDRVWSRTLRCVDIGVGEKGLLSEDLTSLVLSQQLGPTDEVGQWTEIGSCNIFSTCCRFIHCPLPLYRPPLPDSLPPTSLEAKLFFCYFT